MKSSCSSSLSMKIYRKSLISKYLKEFSFSFRCNQIAMHNEGLSLTFCLVLVAATVAVVQAYPAEIGEDEQPLVGLDEKRGWNNFHSGYGKRGWNNFAGGYGKRSFDYVSNTIKCLIDNRHRRCLSESQCLKNV